MPMKRKSWKVVALCYAGALLLYFGICGAQFFLDTQHRQDGQLIERTLFFESFYVEGVLLAENEQGGTDLISTDTDPRMVFSLGEPFYATLFTFSAQQVSRPGGEMQLYYTTQPGEEFSAQKRLTAQEAEDGTWVFDLGGRKVQALRFDLDTTGGILYRDWHVTLNESKPPSAYFLPSSRQVFWLLFLPALTSALLVAGIEIWGNFASQKKKETGY